MACGNHVSEYVVAFIEIPGKTEVDYFLMSKTVANSVDI